MLYTNTNYLRVIVEEFNVIETFVRRWIRPGKQISPEVLALYELGDKHLEVTSLSEVIEVTQGWLRAKGTERWDIPGDMGSLDNLKRLLGELGIAEPVIPELKSFNRAAILGGVYRSIKHRLEALLSSGVTFDKLTILTGNRVIGANQLEVQMLTDLGVFKDGMTEADAAQVVLDTHEGLKALKTSVQSDVFSLPEPEGDGRVTTDDTVAAFGASLGSEDSVVWVGHQPFARQMLTVGRVLRETNGEHRPHQKHALLGPLLAIIEDNPYTLIDAAGRTLYEFGKLSDSFYEELGLL